MLEYQFLAVNLRRFRADARLSQSEVATAAGAPFSQRYISELERGLYPSDRDHVAILARVLSVEPEALVRRVRRLGSRTAA